MSILLFYARNIFLFYATLEFHLKDKIKPEFFQASWLLFVVIFIFTFFTVVTFKNFEF